MFSWQARVIRFSVIIATALLLASPAAAQLAADGDFGIDELELQKEFGDLGGGTLFGTDDAQTDQEVTLEAFVLPATETEPALLAIRASMVTGWHVYSITQKPGGPVPTKIMLEESAQYKLLAGFKANDRPETRTLDVWPDVSVEEHYGTVTWTSPIQIAEGVDLQEITIAGKLDGQVCHDQEGCKPFSFLDTTFTAKLATAEQVAGLRPAPPKAFGEYAGRARNPIIRGHIEPKVVKPGESAKLVLTVVPEPTWHVYARADKADAKLPYRPTVIALTNTSGLQPQAPVTDSPVVVEKGLKYHEGTTTWTIELPVPADAQPGEYKIEGYLAYQVCMAKSCLLPKSVQFRGQINVGPEKVAGMVPAGFDEAGYNTALEASANRIAWADGHAGKLKVNSTDGSVNFASLPLMIGCSLLGGLLLNLMPCVLPVIGLKILSFAEQAGQSRGKVFGLNLSYSAGLLSVFLLLATMAVFLNLGWGEQFTSTWFNVAMCVLVFAMALSFIGVWEIPIPGFVGGESSGKLDSQEGPAGAFFKGVLTTVLATPCSGPFLGPVFGFTLKQPWFVTYVIFGTIGLGMALPYLAIGAFPALVRFLPRPGAWMNTFKQLMGFVLLGTVVFLFSFMNKDYIVATFGLLVGIWLACWWIGRTPLTASFGKRLTAWGGGMLTAALIGLFVFNVLVPQKTKIPWQPYSKAALAQAQAEGKTVMVDFTADWCLTCKTNLKFAINTDDVYAKISANNVVPLLADWTDGSKEIKDTLAQLESKSIPVLAIYPAGRPEEVIVLRDLLTEGQVIDALEKAGPSQPDDEAAVRTAMKPAA